jgi:hypothetical protein
MEKRFSEYEERKQNLDLSLSPEANISSWERCKFAGVSKNSFGCINEKIIYSKDLPETTTCFSKKMVIFYDDCQYDGSLYNPLRDKSCLNRGKARDLVLARSCAYCNHFKKDTI